MVHFGLSTVIGSMAFESIQPADDESSTGESSDYEPNPDTLPASSDPSGLCPRCNRISNFTADSTTDLQKPGGRPVRSARYVEFTDMSRKGQYLFSP
ncbi:hypothetical protein [Nocardia rhamnosiphila]